MSGVKNTDGVYGTVSVYLPVGEVAKIDKLADEMNISRSSAVRMAITSAFLVVDNIGRVIDEMDDLCDELQNLDGKEREIALPHSERLWDYAAALRQFFHSWMGAGVVYG